MASIQIRERDDGTIYFQPDWPGSQPDQPLGVNSGDPVTWNNMTSYTITLVSEPPLPDPDGIYITEPIKSGDVSSPIFSATADLAYKSVDPPSADQSIVIAT